MSCCWCGSTGIPTVPLLSFDGTTRWCSVCIQVLSWSSSRESWICSDLLLGPQDRNLPSMEAVDAPPFLDRPETVAASPRPLHIHVVLPPFVTSDQACPAFIPLPLQWIHLDSADLLYDIGLSEADASFYAPAFDDRGYDSAATLRFITGPILTALGMINVGHRLLFLETASGLIIQFEIQLAYLDDR